MSEEDDTMATLRFAILDGIVATHGRPTEEVVESVLKSILSPDVRWATRSAASREDEPSDAQADR